ncbi:MAG: hypothetical protein NTV31_07260 [Bacteroidia bacterium]|nr:hypothetical protein [Bacteroidia bacterium]
MKGFCLTTMIAAFLLLCINGIQAQTTQIKLNQVELIKQFIGTWKGEVGRDTIVIGKNKQFGTGLDCDIQVVTNAIILDSAKLLYGYDRRNDNFIIAELIKSSPVIELCVAWFTSEKTGEMVLFQDITNPENAKLKWKFEFKTPDTIEQTALLNNKVVKVVTTTRVK